MSLSSDKARKIRDYCTGCVKFNDRTNSCRVLKEPYPLWGKGECWSREESPDRWADTLQEIQAYGEGEQPDPIIAKELTHALKEQDRTVKEVMREDYKTGFPWIKPGGGGGEKADRTNKTFGPGQMKDNRFPHRKWQGWDS